MIRRAILHLCLAGSLLVAPGAPVAAAEGPTLGQYVPASVHMYAGWATTPAAERLFAPFDAAVARLVQSGIGQDIFDLATMDLPPDERREAADIAGRVLALLRGVDWPSLVEHEGAMGFRLGGFLPEYLFLFRVDEGTAEARQQEIHSMLRQIAAFSPDDLFVTESFRAGARISTLGMDGVPIQLIAASKEDIVLVCTSSFLLDASLELVGSADSSGSIVRSAEFQAARERLPKDAYSSVYFDVDGYLGVLRGALELARSHSRDDPPAKAITGIAGALLSALERLDRVVAVERADGSLQIADSITSMSQQGGPGALERLISAQEPIRDFHRVVPADTSSFYFTSGISPGTLYDGALALIREHVPASDRLLGRWERMQEAAGFDVRQDLLSWIDGGWGYVAFAGKGGRDCECVGFLRLRDAEKARAFLRRVHERVAGYLERREQPIETARVELEGLEDFRELRLAALPWFRPAIGIAGDVLIVATSAGALGRVAATFRGEAPSILENPRFRALGVPEGPFVDVSYADVENALEGIANLLGTVGFAASVLPGREVPGQVRELGQILTKLAAFFRDLDIQQDRAGWTRYDGERHELLQRRVVSFKLPEKRTL